MTGLLALIGSGLATDSYEITWLELELTRRLVYVINRRDIQIGIPVSKNRR